jgi:hypothetical protein
LEEDPELERLSPANFRATAQSLKTSGMMGRGRRRRRSPRRTTTGSGGGGQEKLLLSSSAAVVRETMVMVDADGGGGPLQPFQVSPCIFNLNLILYFLFNLFTLYLFIGLLFRIICSWFPFFG